MVDFWAFIVFEYETETKKLNKQKTNNKEQKTSNVKDPFWVLFRA